MAEMTPEQLKLLAKARRRRAELTHSEAVKSGTDILKDSPAGGFVRGLRDIPDAGAQLVTRGLEAVAPEGSPFEDWARKERERVEAINTTAERDYRQNWRGGTPPGLDVGRIGGNIAGTLPLTGPALPTLAGRVAQGISQGGLAAMAQPVEGGSPAQDFWRAKLSQAAVGGGTGALFPIAGSAVSRVVRPETERGVRTLLKEGVPMTPGQTLGGVARNIEDKMTSVPLIGWTIESARKHGVEGFNRAAINRALRPIGKRLPADMPVGREALSEAHEQVSKAYDDVLSKLSLKVDKRLDDDLNGLLGLTKELPGDKARHFENYLYDKVISQMRGSGMDGQTVKEVMSSVKRQARSLGGAPDAWDQKLGTAYKELEDTLSRALERTGGKAAREYKNVNRAFAKLAIAEDAGGRAAALDGVFSPAQYSAAVRAADKSARKNRYARGKALEQDLADPAKAHLPSTVPDSGSPGRGFWPLAAYSGAMYDPNAFGALGAFMGAYSKPGQAALAKILSSRPAAAAPVADAIRKGSARASVGGYPLAEGLFGRGKTRNPHLF